MNMQELLELRSLLTVVHHVPGRLRLRLDPQIRNHPAAGEVASWSGSGAGILATRLNPMARSLIVEYDPKRIDADELEDFLAGTDAARVQALAKTLAKVFGVTTQA
jgi:hypothetical protein